MADIRELWGDPTGKDLYFLGTMTDYYYLETLTGTAVTHVVRDGIKLKILGRDIRTFKPGVPFNIQVGYNSELFEKFLNNSGIILNAAASSVCVTEAQEGSRRW